MTKSGQKPPPKIHWDKIKILIVDDQRSASVLLKSLLTQMGIKHIDIADTYDEAVRACHKTHYNVIMADFHLNHVLNGCELICLLRSKKLISSECGIMMISGDHSAEVILATLSIEPDCFLTKPITNAALTQKITQTLTHCAIRQPVYQALEVNKPERALALCKQQLTEYGHSQKLSDLLLDLLVEQQAWQQLAPILKFLKAKHPSHKVTIVEAKHLAHQGQLSQAIQLVEGLVERSPLCLEGFDLLTHYQQLNHQMFDALTTAKRAFMLTPGASHRALTVAQLAADLGNSEELLNAGRTLATHLPIIDVNWIIRFAEFNAIFEQLYFSQHNRQARREMLQQLKGIQHRAFSRLLPAQQPFLTAYGHIVRARIYLAEDKPFKAKRRALIGISHYFEKIAKLPSVLLVELLPILIQLGELQLIAEVHHTLSIRDRFDGHSQQRMALLSTNTVAIKAIQTLAKQLAEAKSYISVAPQHAVSLYDAILVRYPYSSEANLGYLDALSRLPTESKTYTRLRRLAISAMPLPADLALWRNQVLLQLDLHAPDFTEPPKTAVPLLNLGSLVTNVDPTADIIELAPPLQEG
ncbi:hypothetical protein A3K86_13055 [Photobacterium jeanii]|uniref:Response regulatory domain-containing protein n=1 Tax=Photobacterium jeanii TaxID=858640 RepID=A0A178K9C3_9GAMM|nr:response regulator [Photobacterium jeanii]OAN13949.1 hypothetical protein A3K86_13055 [Photobacterium jeanii]PST89934.1 response regulator [Photobacterium jeanii]